MVGFDVRDLSLKLVLSLNDEGPTKLVRESSGFSSCVLCMYDAGRGTAPDGPAELGPVDIRDGDGDLVWPEGATERRLLFLFNRDFERD